MANPALTETAGAGDRVSLSALSHPAEVAGAADTLLAVRIVTPAEVAGAADRFTGARVIALADAAGAADRAATAYDIETLWDHYLQAKETAITAESDFRMTVNGCGIGFSGPQYLDYYQARMAADTAYNTYLLARNPRRPLD